MTKAQANTGPLFPAQIAVLERNGARSYELIAPGRDATVFATREAAEQAAKAAAA